MNKLFHVLTKIFKLIYRIIDKFIVLPISTFVFKVQTKLGKDSKLEKLLNRPYFLLYLSLFFAVALFLLVDYKAVSLVNTDAEFLTNQPVRVLYNSSAYVIEGVPETVDITLTGKKSELYLAKQLGDNEVVIDLTDIDDSKETVDVKLTYNKNLDSINYKIDPSYVTVSIKKKVSGTKIVTYDLLNKDELDAKLSVRSVELSKNDVVVRGAQDTLDKIASVKALIDLSNSDYVKAGTYTVDNVNLVAYGSDGNVIKNVEIVATKISATIVLESYSKKVPVSIRTQGNLISGKAISAITINGKDANDYDVTIYGEQSVLDGITSIPVTLDINGQGTSSSKTSKVVFSKPSGVRHISEDTVTVVLTFGEAKQKTISINGIKTTNVPNGLAANLASSSDMVVEVQVIGVESVISSLNDNSNNIEAYVDLAGYSAGNYSVKVQIRGTDSRLQYVVSKNVNVVLTKVN